MNLMDKFKSAVFEEDAEPTPVHKKDDSKFPPPAEFTPKYQQPGSMPWLTQTNVVSPPVTSNKRQVLLDELAKNSIGSPYAQFQKINAGMKLKIADVATRCIAIGASLEAQGITKQQIIDSANNATAFLNSESANFQADVDANINRQLQFQNTKAQEIASQLELKQNQIKTLAEEISALQKDSSQLDIDSQASKTKFDVSQLEFKGSLVSILQEINADISAITTYLS